MRHLVLNCVRASVIVVLLLIASAGTLRGQSTTGTLLGTVRDSSGGVIIGATVTLTNKGTGISSEVMTNALGDYVVPNLPPARYKILVEAPGFRTVEISEILLPLNSTVRTDVHLEPGIESQNVVVSGNVSAINSETSSVGTIVNSRSLLTLPLNGRTLDRLVQTTAGNTSDGSAQPQIAGAAFFGGTFWTVDGIAYQDSALGRAASTPRIGLAQLPSLETIQEFKVESSLAKAEYEGSAAISIVTKSGTNEFHGSVFEFNRNRALAAKNFFLTDQPKPVFNRNEFGAAIGGPIIKNRMFFFISYEGLRQRIARNIALTLPTNAMRAGNFAGLAPILDPLSGQLFPENRIPQDRLDGRALSLQEFLPLPNTPGTGAAGTGINHTGSVGEPIGLNRYTVRIDDQITRANSLSIILNRSRANPMFIAIGGPSNYGNVADSGRLTKNASLALSSSISSTTFNEFRYAYFVNMEFFAGQNLDFRSSDLFPGLFAESGGLPTVNIAGFQGISDFGHAQGLAPQIRNQITDNFTKIVGPHTLKTGVELVSQRQSRPINIEAPAFGSFTFNGRYSGNSYADFLLGYPVLAARSTPSLISTLRFWQASGYFQDDWKVTPRLTFNLGLRYGFVSAPEERDGQMSNFDFESGRFVIRSVGGTVPARSIPRLLDAYPIFKSEDIGWGSQMFLADSSNFAPRVGFAYRPFGNTRIVLRGGYGIYHNFISYGMGIFATFFANPPFLLSETFEAVAGSAPSLSLANPFPGQGQISANPRALAVDRQLRQGYVQQWNLTVEQELLSDLAVRISYVGNNGTHVLRFDNDLNLPLTQAPGTIQSRRRFQPWANIPTLQFNGNSITHQLQLEVTQRFRSGLSFQSSYTWNKTLDDVPLHAVQNVYRPELDRSYADRVRNHAFYTSAIYELPIGPGKRFVPSPSRVVGFLTGGWSVGTILQFRSGSPFSVNFSPNLAGWYATRADALGNPSATDKSIEQWFNPAAFATPAPFTFGNSARNTLFGPGQKIIDLSVIKDTNITDTVTAQFRAEFFNFPNTPSFGNPASNISFPATVGRIRTTSVDARTVQFGLKLIF